MQEYADRYWEVLLKVLEHILDFLQVHKFVLGLKESLWPLVHKEKCTTLNEAIELAIVLEDGKKFPTAGSQRSPWMQMPRSFGPTTSTLPSTIEVKAKRLDLYISLRQLKEQRERSWPWQSEPSIIWF